MQKSVVLAPLLRYAGRELGRRRAWLKESDDDAARADGLEDLVALVETLRQSENHLLAIQVLLGSWTCSIAKGRLIRESLQALGRKILSYREIDMTLAVGCLSRLPYDTMVKELKSAVPSIQSDFGRLRTVAAVGEELARMWGEDDLLMLFSNIQTSARWWHILASHGVDIDPRLFAASVSPRREEAMRAVVPALLAKSNLDLDLVLEYCQQFEIDGSYANACFIQKYLLQSPTSLQDQSWATQIRRAASRMNDASLITALQDNLTAIHGLDYEKIRFVCTWLIDCLGDCDVDDDTVSSPELLATITEVDIYRKCLSLATYLSGQRFHHMATAKVASSLLLSSSSSSSTTHGGGGSRRSSGDVTNEGQQQQQEEQQEGAWTSGPYAGLAVAYRTRLPLWSLLKDPWGVLEPLMRCLPGVAKRIFPLCDALQIDADELHARSAQAAYVGACQGTLIDSAATDNDTGLGVGSALELFTESTSYIASPEAKAENWQWLYERDKRDPLRGTVLHGTTTLGHALSSLSVHIHTSPDGCPVVNAAHCVALPLATNIMYEYVKLQCEGAMGEWAAAHPQCSAALPTGTTLGLLLGDHQALLTSVLDTCARTAWTEQICAAQRNASATAGDGILHVLDALDDSLAPSVLSLTVSLGRLASRLAGLLTMLNCFTGQESDSSSSSGENSPTVPKGAQRAPINVMESTLEAARHALLSATLFGAGTDTTTATTTAATTTATATATTDGEEGGGVTRTRKGGRGSDELSMPTTGELRRQEDLFLAFSCATLIASCGEARHRAAYAKQLMAVAKGTTTGGIGPGGDKTTPPHLQSQSFRSRLRAIQALVLLREYDPASRPAAVVLKEFLPLRNFLFCATELTEIRVNTTTESLAAAVESTSLAQALMQTWMHDEGELPEAVELARDLLFCAGCTDIALWAQLLRQMVQQGMGRAYLCTLVALRRRCVFQGLLSDPGVNADLGPLLARAVEQGCESLLHSVTLMADPTEPVAEVMHDGGGGVNWLEEGCPVVTKGLASEHPGRAVSLLRTATSILEGMKVGNEVLVPHTRATIVESTLRLVSCRIPARPRTPVDAADTATSVGRRFLHFLRRHCTKAALALLLPALAPSSDTDGGTGRVTLLSNYLFAVLAMDSSSDSGSGDTAAAAAAGSPAAVEQAWALISAALDRLGSEVVARAMSSADRPSWNRVLGGLLRLAAQRWTQSRQDAAVAGAVLRWIITGPDNLQSAASAAAGLSTADRRSLLLAAQRHGLKLPAL
jgi:hypothetical protein